MRSFTKLVELPEIIDIDQLEAALAVDDVDVHRRPVGNQQNGDLFTAVMRGCFRLENP
jgi:hypothetical protein